MSPEVWLLWVNRIYFGASGLAALAAAVTVVAGLVQSRLSDAISDRKDREFAEFRILSETRVAELQKLTAEANQKAEEERLARIRMEQRLAPRRLSSAQQDAVTSKLSSFQQVSADLIVCGNDSDIGPLSEAIEGAMEAAGWHARTWSAMGGLRATGIVVQIEAGSPPEIGPAADALVAALQAEHIDAARWASFVGKKVPAPLTGPLWDESKVAPIRLIIGTKP